MGDEKQEKTGKIKFLQIKRRAIKIQRKDEKRKWKSPKITVWKQEEEGVVDKRRQIRKSSTSTELRVPREETSDDGSVVLPVLSQRRTSEKTPCNYSKIVKDETEISREEDEEVWFMAFVKNPTWNFP
ncbi:hypothetical protein RUM44_010113 [Polyplax serrata]|uniref:Uncharacterized protein n=1 Tax=Polyplax serrata TaxID=468196 RepID=A0ABR1AUL1_POLSC